MTKVSILALAALVSTLGFTAAPASAAAAPFCFGSDNDHEISDNLDRYAALLKEQGVKASSIEEWGGCIRAYVTDSAGHTTIVFFDPDSLQQVGPVDSAATLG